MAWTWRQKPGNVEFAVRIPHATIGSRRQRRRRQIAEIWSVRMIGCAVKSSGFCGNFWTVSSGSPIWTNGSLSWKSKLARRRNKSLNWNGNLDYDSRTQLHLPNHHPRMGWRESSANAGEERRVAAPLANTRPTAKVGFRWSFSGDRFLARTALPTSSYS